jgi:hypothetical protein
MVNVIINERAMVILFIVWKISIFQNNVQNYKIVLIIEKFDGLKSKSAEGTIF